MSDDDIENDFDDDFDTDGFDDGGFDDLDDKSGTLGDLWRNNPLVKIGVILAALAFLVGGIILFGGKKDNLPESRVTGGAELTEAPGTAAVTETYRQAIEEENTRRIEQAVRENDSAIPMPVDPPKGSLPLQFEEPEEEDPLERWRRMQEDRIRQQQVQNENLPDAPEAPPVDTKTPAINALAGAMAAQMEGVLGQQAILGPTLQKITTITYLESLQAAERAKLEAALAQQQALVGNTAIDDLNIILPAGTIEYAQTLIESNTDAPGPVLAQIVTGPLKGARIIGSFSETYDYLTLNFNTIVLDGVDFAANGIAIDPDTTLPGVITDIDRRYFRRIILPTAAAFVTGLAGAIADSGTTSVSILGGDSVSTTTSTADRDFGEEVSEGVEEAGEQLGDIIEEISDQTKPMLRVAAGTPIGILFVSPVVGTPQLIQQKQLEQPSQGIQFPVNPAAAAVQNLLPSQ